QPALQVVRVVRRHGKVVPLSRDKAIRYPHRCIADIDGPGVNAGRWAVVNDVASDGLVTTRIPCHDEWFDRDGTAVHVRVVAENTGRRDDQCDIYAGRIAVADGDRWVVHRVDGDGD